MARHPVPLLGALLLAGHQAVAVAQTEPTLDELKTRTRELEQVRNDLLLDVTIDLVRTPGSAARTARLAQFNKALPPDMPRKLFVGVRSEDPNVAAYVQAVVERVAATGKVAYPDAAHGRIGGQPIVSWEIDAVGNLLGVTLTRSSGHAALDEAAMQAVRRSAPFAPFPVEVRVVADILDITRQFSFTAGLE